MEHTNIKVEFSIYGENFDPLHITEILNINPSTSYLKGDKIPGKHIKRKETSWNLETKYEESLDINDGLSKIVSLIIEKREILKKVGKLYNVKILFMFVINIVNSETPAIYFRKSFVEFAAEIGSEIGFDTYIY